MFEEFRQYIKNKENIKKNLPYVLCLVVLIITNFEEYVYIVGFMNTLEIIFNFIFGAIVIYFFIGLFYEYGIKCFFGLLFCVFSVILGSHCICGPSKPIPIVIGKIPTNVDTKKYTSGEEAIRQIK